MHPWFELSPCAGFAVTTHEGAPLPGVGGATLAAYLRARRLGYRRMQVDVVFHGGKLWAHHATFGRLFGSQHDVGNKLRAAVTLRELVLETDELRDVYWNIEIKSRQGRATLLELLDEVAARRDRSLQRILVSSPVWPSISHAVAEAHPDVALAAPAIHGGVFGVRFLGRRRAEVPSGAMTKPYDCQQCWHRAVRADDRNGRPLRQVWTIRTSAAFQRTVPRFPHLIASVTRISFPRRDAPAVWPPCPPVAVVAEAKARDARDRVRAVALGGGGWRSAFGAIGAITYLSKMEMWQHIDQAVGVSGGSFAVAKLATKPDAQPEPEPELKELLEALSRAGGSMRKTVLFVIWPVLALLGGLAASTWLVWNADRLWVLLAVGLTVATSFLVRWAASVRLRRIVRVVIGKEDRMVAGSQGSRAYRVGATGLNDGKLYGYTTRPDLDRPRWESGASVTVPLAERPASDAVVRSTSLPGLGQLGYHRLYLCERCTGDDHDESCRWVPDRLVDGGISGIFGRGLVSPVIGPPSPPGQEPILLAVDAGRSLTVETPQTIRDRLLRFIERASAIFHLTRWLYVAFDVSYQGELLRVADGQLSDGHRTCTVRLAEEETPAGLGTPAPIDPQRRDDLARLFVLRDQVHSFSLVKASEENIDRGIAVAVAACALEFELQPDINARLEEVDEALGRGHRLSKLWRDIPLIDARP